MWTLSWLVFGSFALRLGNDGMFIEPPKAGCFSDLRAQTHSTLKKSPAHFVARRPKYFSQLQPLPSLSGGASAASASNEAKGEISALARVLAVAAEVQLGCHQPLGLAQNGNSLQQAIPICHSHVVCAVVGMLEWEWPFQQTLVNGNGKEKHWKFLFCCFSLPFLSHQERRQLEHETLLLFGCCVLGGSAIRTFTHKTYFRFTWCAYFQVFGVSDMFIPLVPCPNH